MTVSALTQNQSQIIPMNMDQPENQKYNLLTMQDYKGNLIEQLRNIFTIHILTHPTNQKTAHKLENDDYTQNKANWNLTKNAFKHSWRALTNDEYIHGLKQLGHALIIGSAHLSRAFCRSVTTITLVVARFFAITIPAIVIGGLIALTGLLLWTLSCGRFALSDYTDNNETFIAVARYGFNSV